MYLRIQEPLIALLNYKLSFALPLLEVLQPFCVWSLPRGASGVVINVIYPASRITSHFPTWRQRLRSLPRRTSCVVIHVVPAKHNKSIFMKS